MLENTVPIANKFPDPVDPPQVPIVENPVLEQEEKKSKKSFWMKVVLFLIFVPVLAGSAALIYQVYRQVSLTQGATELAPGTPEIDPNDVVVPEELSEGEFEEVMESTLESTINSAWELFADPQGVSLHYPADQLVVESVPSEDPSVFSVITLKFKSDVEVENPTNMIELTIQSAEINQSATQSATKDFSTQEFKVFEYPTSTVWVGQLPSGSWMQVRMRYTSQIQRRELLEQVISGIEVFAPSQI